MKALRLPARALLVPYGFGSRPHAFLRCSCSPKRSCWAWRSPSRPGTWSAGYPIPACCTRGRVRGLTGSLAIHPVPLPCSRTPAEPTKPRLWRSCRCCPRAPKTEDLSDNNFEANTRLQHPLSTLQERRRRRPCKTRFRLAGCAFAGRGSNPLDRFERFQVTYRPPFQGLACRNRSVSP